MGRIKKKIKKIKNERQGVFFYSLGARKDGGWKKKRVWLRCGRKRKRKRERERERGSEKKRTNERTH